MNSKAFISKCKCLLALYLSLSIIIIPSYGEDIVKMSEFKVSTGTGTEKFLLETPVRTELITRKELDISSAANLADAIDFTTGVRVESNCQNCNFSQVRLLGLEGSYSQILIDGQALISSLASVYGVEQIPSSMIESVEVVKGGGSALYGPGSIGGIINVITRDPLKNIEEFEASFGSIKGDDDGNEYSLNGISHYRSENGKYSMTLFGQYSNRDGVDYDGDGYTELAEKELASIGVKLNRYFKEDKAKLWFDYTYLYEDRRGGDLLDLPVTSANVAEAVESKNNILSLGFSDQSFDNMDYKFAISSSLLKRDTYYGAGQDPNAFGESESPVYAIDYRMNHHFDAHTLTWGLQYNKEELEDKQKAYNRITDEDYDNTGAMIQDDWKINDNCELVYGLRVDKHSELSDSVLSPRAAFKLSNDNNFTARLSVASGFKAPQVFDEDLHIEIVNGEALIIRNASNLKEEESVSYSLSCEWRPSLWSGMALLEGNLFFTKIDDTFFLDEDDDPLTDDFEFTRINRGASEVKGIELNAGYQQNNFNALLGFVSQKAEFDTADDDFGVKDYFRTPEQYGVFKIIWDIPNWVEIFIGAKYTGEMKVPHYAGYIAEDTLEMTDESIEIDLSISKTFQIGESDFTLSLVGKNITDEYQDDLDQGPDRDAGYIYGARYPRSVYLKGKLVI